MTINQNVYRLITWMFMYLKRKVLVKVANIVKKKVLLALLEGDGVNWNFG